MILANFIICLMGAILGFSVLIKHLKIFSHDKTPTVDAWLVAVGTLAWSLFLYSSYDSLVTDTAWIDENTNQYTATVIARAFFLIYWIGALLQVQKHCLRFRIRKRRALERKNAN